MWKKLGIVAIVATGLSVFSMACAADEDCIAGKTCTCANCNKTCDGDSKKGCNFSCTGGNCSFTCEGGGCQIDATNADSVTVDCKGGGCSVTSTNTKTSAVACAGDRCSHACSGGQSCKTTQCKTGCSLACGGAATCEQSCTEAQGCAGGGASAGSSSGGVPDVDAGGYDPSQIPGAGDFGMP